MKVTEIIRKAARAGNLSLQAAREISSDCRLPLMEVEKAALRLGIWPLRYYGHSPELRPDEQLRLLESTVLVAGCGGLGGYCASYLARLGTGHLVLVDPDSFDETNMNRQLFCTTDTLCRKKVRVTADAISSINPAICTEILPGPVEHAGEPVSRADVILDCLDNVPSRLNLARMCHEAGVPLVHGAVSGTMGQVAVEFSGDRIMQRLYPGPDIRRDSHGQFAFSVAAVAAMQCSEALKLLLGWSSSIRNTWAFFDIREPEIATGPVPD